MRWSAALPWASAVLLGSLLAYSMRKNVQLASALRRKDQDLQFMVLKVIVLLFRWLYDNSDCLLPKSIFAVDSWHTVLKWHQQLCRF